MSGKNKVICFECSKKYASYRCARCGYQICKSCAVKLGGGAFSYPECPSCHTRSWLEAKAD